MGVGCEQGRVCVAYQVCQEDGARFVVADYKRRRRLAIIDRCGTCTNPQDHQRGLRAVSINEGSLCRQDAASDCGFDDLECLLAGLVQPQRNAIFTQQLLLSTL